MRNAMISVWIAAAARNDSKVASAACASASCTICSVTVDTQVASQRRWVSVFGCSCGRGDMSRITQSAARRHSSDATRSPVSSSSFAITASARKQFLSPRHGAAHTHTHIHTHARAREAEIVTRVLLSPQPTRQGPHHLHRVGVLGRLIGASGSVTDASAHRVTKHWHVACIAGPRKRETRHAPQG